MFQPLITSFQQIGASIHDNLPFLLGMTAMLWLLLLINAAMGYRLNIMGIYPRHLWGLPGIFISPFLHGSSTHLFFNSIPLFALSALILINGKPFFLMVTFLLIILSGVLVWLFGRKALHVGASSVIMGYWSFLLLNAYEQRSPTAIILGFICAYYFGGLLFSLFPQEERVSWEGHIFGFLSGLLVSYGYTHHYLTRFLQ
jgi:membrane associated rhomboid family serine protease